MRRRHTKTVLILLIAIILIGTSIIPAFSINLKYSITDFVENKVESSIDERINESYPYSTWSYKDVMNPNLGYDIDRMGEYEDYRDRLFDRYDMNSYDELDECHLEYLEHHKELMERYENRKPQKLDNTPSERPDFENGTTWYVDDVPGEGLDNPQEDFIKIQDAIDSNLVVDGDTIYVHNGIYYENVAVDKTIKIQGEDKNSTIIDGNGERDVIYITTDWVTITGFKIGNNVNGLKAKYTALKLQIEYLISICNINDNLIINNDIGIKISNSNRILISNCIIRNNNFGIYQTDSNQTLLINNTIKDNKENAIILINSSFNTIENNKMNNNSGGLFIQSSLHNKINNNKFYDNSYGIFLSNSSENQLIENNTIYNNSNDGIVIGYNSHNQSISNNIIYNNLNNGIFMWYSDNNNIFNNSFKSNKYGINSWSSIGNNIYDNSFLNNSKSGISIQSISMYRFSVKNIILNNFVIGSEYGIDIRSSLYNKISNNTIRYNENGIFCFAVSNSSITNNTCKNNNIDGILSFVSENNTIASNTCIDNIKGIAIRMATSDIVINNYCTRNHNGILINNGNILRIRGNLCSRNNIGIFLSDSQNNIIAENICNYNSHKGITLRNNSIYNVIVNNQIGPWNYQGIYIEKSHFNNIHHNNITKNNDDGIGLVQTKFNRIHHNNIIDNTDHAIEGLFCFDDARNNYWGRIPPRRWVRWVSTNEEDADIYTPGGIILINCYLKNPIELKTNLTYDPIQIRIPDDIITGRHFHFAIFPPDSLITPNDGTIKIIGVHQLEQRYKYISKHIHLLDQISEFQNNSLEHPSWMNVTIIDWKISTSADGVEHNFSILLSIDEKEAPKYSYGFISLDLITWPYIREILGFGGEFYFHFEIPIITGEW